MTLQHGGSTRSLAVVACLCAQFVLLASGCRTQAPPTALKEVSKARSGEIEVVLLASSDSLPQGKGEFALEFLGADGALIDPGTVRVTATMAMAGMAPMLGDTSAKTSTTKGRYDVASDFSMAGTWQLKVEWDGPAGRGSVSMPGAVR